MPENSRRIFATQTVRLSKMVHAPLHYVYDWCTDFRSDDGKFSRSKPRFRVIKLSPRRVVRVRMTPIGAKGPVVAVELVRLRPPNAWHVDGIDEGDFGAVDYKLTRLGPEKTRVTLVIVERWMVPRYPKKGEWLPPSSKYWDHLVRVIEKRYHRGLPAKG